MVAKGELVRSQTFAKFVASRGSFLHVFACTILRETLEDKARKGGLKLMLWWRVILMFLLYRF